MGLVLGRACRVRNTDLCMSTSASSPCAPLPSLLPPLPLPFPPLLQPSRTALQGHQREEEQDLCQARRSYPSRAFSCPPSPPFLRGILETTS